VRPGTLLRDAARLWRAGRDHLRERKSSGRLELGLAFLEIEGEPVPGEIVTARTAVTELGAEPRGVRLVLDFWLEGGSDATRGHVGGVVVEITTRPRRQVELAISTDARDHREAWCQGQRLECRPVPGADPWGRHCVALAILQLGGDEIDRIVARPRWKAAVS
jgi:hypothetical protein